MRIKVFTDEIKIRLVLPNCILFNRFSAKFINKGTKNAVTIKGKQMRKIRKIIKKHKRQHHDWKLVEVRTGDNVIVEIKP